MPGNSDFGAADTLFPRLVTASFLNDADNDTINLGPGGVVTNNNYGNAGNVADADPRIISNLIVDMSLNNPAAVAAALKYAGIEGAEATAAAADIATARALVQSTSAGVGPAAAAEAAALAALNSATTALNAAIAADTAAQATFTAYTAAIALAPASATAATEARDAVTLFASLVGPTAEAGDLALLGAAITEATEAQTAAAAVLAVLASGPNVTAADLATATANSVNAALLVTQLTNLQTALNLDPNVNAPDVAAAAGLGITNVIAANAVASSLNDANSLGQATTNAATAAGNLTTANAAFTSAQNTYDAAVIASDAADTAGAAAASDFAALLDGLGVILNDGGSLVIPNTAPDEGLSAPFNSWFTLFGQFFDHGLDLVTKGQNGFVFVPLEADDPLVTHGPDGVAGTGDEVTNPSLQFMALKRATPDGTEHTNTTTSWIDQNQTYTSHASHQVFLREYELRDIPGDVLGPVAVATGGLLEAANGGPANWAQVKDQAATMLGITLTDYDIVNVPKLVTDEYGKFIPGANGFAQIETASGIVEGVAGGLALPLDTIRTGHAFLDDIAHAAVPFHSQTGVALAADDDNATGLSQAGRYDDELLDAHKITGDGRGNENIGPDDRPPRVPFGDTTAWLNTRRKSRCLPAIETGGQAGLDFLNEWLDPAFQVAALPANQAEIDSFVWDGERVFQAAKFGTEMQYQHLVFEEFARKVQPLDRPLRALQRRHRSFDRRRVRARRLSLRSLDAERRRRPT